jgi:IS1 family transposase
MNRLPFEKQVQVINCLVEGVSVRATCRMTDVAKGTVLRLLTDVGAACLEFHDAKVRNVKARRVQCDEIWSFCYAKAKNVPEQFKGQYGYGDIWTWVALDADTKLAISWTVGQRDADAAHVLMRDLAFRLATRIQLTTDGYGVYLDAVETAFGSFIDYAMLVKLYGRLEEEANHAYSPPQCTASVAKPITGRPNPRHISTSYIERQNLTMRMSMRRFTRLTNAFSKKVENLAHAVALYFG